MRTLLACAVTFACLTGCSARPDVDFYITDKSIGKPIAGFGVCMNPYLYAFPNTPNEISPQALADLEAKVKKLHPQFVRVFFLNSWWEQDTDPDIAKNVLGMRESVIRTIRLAQDAGANVLLQLWYDPQRYPDPDNVAQRFARAILELRQKYGLTSIRFATLQNEPNEEDSDITMPKYVQLYRAFDCALRYLGIRDAVQIIGGDLVVERQQHWFELLARDVTPVLDGYSIHVYWDYWDIERMLRHIHGVSDIVANLSPKQRRPVYITEFGALGFRDSPKIEPGKSDDGKPLADVPTYSFEIGILLLESINAGFLGTAQWDLYDIWYDRKMGYGLIGSVQDGFPLKPGYHLLRMFTQSTQPGWRAVRIHGQVEDVWIAALKGPADHVSVYVLNRVKATKSIAVAGLPPSLRLNVWIWNADGTGTLKKADTVSADAHGVVTLRLPHMTIAVVTTDDAI